MESKKRKRLSSEEKVRIIKLHLLEKKPVSDLCDIYKIHPNQYYKWQTEFFQNALNVFDNKANSKDQKLNKKIEDLENKLTRKNEVLSELMEEHINIKKKFGDL